MIKKAKLSKKKKGKQENYELIISPLTPKLNTLPILRDNGKKSVNRRYM